jgi:hypothetical protein
MVYSLSMKPITVSCSSFKEIKADDHSACKSIALDAPADGGRCHRTDRSADRAGVPVRAGTQSQSLNLWPTPIGTELKRFIGAIIVANGFGAAMIVRQGSWEAARVLFAVALIYGIAVFAILLYDLALGVAAPFFWVYIALDAIFLVPIAYIYWYH